MNVARSFVAAASSLFWPAMVFAVPVGITFGAARVYAESGVALPPTCTDSKVTACADAGAGQACDCGGGFDCACTEKTCIGPSGPTPALVCTYLATSCRSYSLAPCEGKSEGASCVQTDGAGAPTGPGTCKILSSGCVSKNDAGAFESRTPLACVATSSGSGATPAPSSTVASDSDGDGSSGCSTAPGAIRDSMLFAMPLGLGVALALRRVRRRRTCASRGATPR